MANWRALTEADLMTRLSGKELLAFRNTGFGPGEVDPVSTLLGSVTDKVRGAIAGDPRNVLGPDGQLPRVLIDAALSIAVLRVMTRCFGEVLDPSGQRVKDGESAEGILRDVARGEGPGIPGMAADDGDAVTGTRAPLPMEYESDHVEDFEREDQDGL